MSTLEAILGGCRELEPPPGLALPPLDERSWTAAVGKRIARRTQPLRLERGVLYVRAATAAWATELSFLAETILEQLGQQGIVATSLRFSVGAIGDRPGDPRPVPPRRRRPAVLPPELRAHLDAVEDERLRSSLARAAAYTLNAEAAHFKSRAAK